MKSVDFIMFFFRCVMREIPNIKCTTIEYGVCALRGSEFPSVFRRTWLPILLYGCVNRFDSVIAINWCFGNSEIMTGLDCDRCKRQEVSVGNEISRQHGKVDFSAELSEMCSIRIDGGWSNANATVSMESCSFRFLNYMPQEFEY